MAQNKKPTPIFEALNNSLLFAVCLIGLGVYVYQNDQDRQDGRLDTTTMLIQSIQRKQETQNGILLRMQEFQIQIAKQIERNTDKINALGGNVLTNSDGRNIETSLSQRIEAQTSDIRALQSETHTNSMHIMQLQTLVKGAEEK
jgi:hypothetical protein